MNVVVVIQVVQNFHPPLLFLKLRGVFGSLAILPKFAKPLVNDVVPNPNGRRNFDAGFWTRSFKKKIKKTKINNVHPRRRKAKKLGRKLCPS